jgi:hypothetical protein
MPPRLSRRHIILRHIARMGITTFFGAIFLAADQSSKSDRIAGLLALAACAFALVTQLLVMIRDASTTITPTTVSQQRWFRTVSVEWRAVDFVVARRHFNTIRLKSGESEVVLSPVLFEDWNSAIEDMRALLPPGVLGRVGPL